RDERAVADALVEPVAELAALAGALRGGGAAHAPTSFFSAVPCRNLRKSTSTQPSFTRVASASIARGDGPLCVAPSTPKLDVWHGHAKTFLSPARSIAQPRCGHVALSARTSLPLRTSHTEPSCSAG